MANQQPTPSLRTLLSRLQAPHTMKTNSDMKTKPQMENAQLRFEYDCIWDRGRRVYAIRANVARANVNFGHDCVELFSRSRRGGLPKLSHHDGVTLTKHSIVN